MVVRAGPIARSQHHVNCVCWEKNPFYDEAVILKPITFYLVQRASRDKAGIAPVKRKGLAADKEQVGDHIGGHDAAKDNSTGAQIEVLLHAVQR